MIIIKENNISRYLDELDEKVQKAREASADTPRIGIFWLHLKDGKVRVFFSITETLEFGQEYGNFIVSAKGHYVIWDSLKAHDIAPKNSQYEDLPRGRVAYDKDLNQYVVYHGNYIKSGIAIIKSVIKSEFKLKANTRWEPDLHYHKFKRWGF